MVRRLWYYYLYLLIVWGGFRYLVRLPEALEELWFKPLLWLTPLFWWNLSLRDKVVMFGGGWTSSVLWGMFIGAAYYGLIRLQVQEVAWSFDLWGVAIVTAVTEELTFSGFVAGYLEKIQKKKWLNLLTVGLMVAIVRVPILFFVYKLSGLDLVGVLFLAGTSGAINAWIRVRTKNVTGSILARMGMNLAVLG